MSDIETRRVNLREGMKLCVSVIDFLNGKITDSTNDAAYVEQCKEEKARYKNMMQELGFKLKSLETAPENIQA